MRSDQQFEEVVLSLQDAETMAEFETIYRQFKHALEKESDSRISKNKTLEKVMEVSYYIATPIYMYYDHVCYLIYSYQKQSIYNKYGYLVTEYHYIIVVCSRFIIVV